MRHVDLPLHELAIVGATRALGGLGIGLLVADRLAPDARRAVGWTLVGLGLLTSLPLAASVVRRVEPRLLGD